MIIIPRRQNESIVIGEGIVITVVEIRGNTVRLSIEHPQGASIHRGEVYCETHKAASELTPPR
jgi:carbon storage regulator